MTTLTYAANTIMAYVGSDADVVGYSGLVVMPDWPGTKVYFLQTAISGPGLRQFDIDPDGDETLQRGKAAIGVAGINAASGGAAALSNDGTQLFFISESNNSVRLAEVKASDLTLTAQFGTSSSNATASTTARLLGIHMMATQSGKLFMSTAGNTGELDMLPQSGFSPNANLGVTDEKATAGVLIGPGGGSANYVVALPFGNSILGAHNSDPVGLYHVNSSGTITKRGTFVATDVDAAWTRFFTIRGVAYDENDGNVIIGAATDESGPTNTKYIVKLNASNADVMWVRAVNILVPYSWGFTNSRITNDRFHYLGNSALVYHINTTNGAVTTETFTGVSATGPQASDDVSNSIILFGGFTPGGSPPDYVGTYMDTGGHHTLSSKWMRIWFATVGGSSEGTGGRQGGLALSDLRAWTFTLDGHTFYVLDLGAEGTFAYDTTTQQWARFITEGYSGRWDVTNGIMWGKERIIGGDLENTKIWELTAAALTDQDDAIEITHAITGGLQTRRRDKLPVSAVRVTGSVGDLGDATGATIALRFSDDNGHTWVGPFTVTLTQADYSGEIAYRSLGSFAAPGRIFELTDTSGPKRIDGVDAEIEGADDGGAAG